MEIKEAKAFKEVVKTQNFEVWNATLKLSAIPFGNEKQELKCRVYISVYDCEFWKVSENPPKMSKFSKIQ